MRPQRFDSLPRLIGHYFQTRRRAQIRSGMEMAASALAAAGIPLASVLHAPSAAWAPECTDSHECSIARHPDLPVWRDHPEGFDGRARRDLAAWEKARRPVPLPPSGTDQAKRRA